MTDEENRPSEQPQEAMAPPTQPEMQQDAPSAEPIAEKPPLNDQKKNALMRYMAVLFGVAFLLVALSFLIQMRNSNQQISQLSKNNASALQNAETLQNENRALTEKNQQLTQELDATSDELQQTNNYLEEAEKSLTASDAAVRNMQDGLKAYSLLTAALERQARSDATLTLDSLKELTAVKSKLDPAGLALYDNLVAALTAAS